MQKILKNKKKSGPEIWWTGSFSQNLALIHLMVSEKTGFTDGRTDGWMYDAQTDAGRLRDDSSSAVQ